MHVATKFAMSCEMFTVMRTLVDFDLYLGISFCLHSTGPVSMSFGPIPMLATHHYRPISMALAHAAKVVAIACACFVFDHEILDLLNDEPERLVHHQIFVPLVHHHLVSRMLFG